MKNDLNTGQEDNEAGPIESVRREKAAIRTRILRIRSELTPVARAEKSIAIRNNILALCKRHGPGLIHIFLPFGDEPETRPLLEPLWGEGFRLVVPVVSAEGLLLAPLEPRTALYPGPFGILEPRDFKPVPEDSVTLYFLPGVAFDRKGGRLGYGKGYYDRLLSQCPSPKFGVSFDEQIVASVPLVETDILVDGIITDKEILYRD